MKNIIVAIVAVIAVAITTFTIYTVIERNKKIGITLWIKEDESKTRVQWIKSIADDFSASDKRITIDILGKDSGKLAQNNQDMALSATMPDLLWTGTNSIDSLIEKKLIQPVGRFIEAGRYMDSIVLNGETWAVPILYGNHLMLMANKKYIDELPVNTDQLISRGREARGKNGYGLVYNQKDANWIIPWIGGFGSSIFKEDGKTPNIDTKAMVNTLKFLKKLVYKHKITPPGTDYFQADSLFREGKAAMIINGDWAIAEYQEILGENLIVGRIPKVSSTGIYPTPYKSGDYFLIPSSLPQEKEEVISDFIAYATSEYLQEQQLSQTFRMAGIRTIYSKPPASEILINRGSISQLEVCLPRPTGFEINTILATITRKLPELLKESKIPEESVKELDKAVAIELEKRKTP
ncbi:MAG: extracellular solute-binding protein [bacterium]|nr:extracellular solute-binding protein [bacterium]